MGNSARSGPDHDRDGVTEGPTPCARGPGGSHYPRAGPRLRTFQTERPATRGMAGRFRTSGRSC